MENDILTIFGTTDLEELSKIRDESKWWRQLCDDLNLDIDTLRVRRKRDRLSRDIDYYLPMYCREIK